MARLKRRPQRFEEIKGIGPKRASTLRNQFGSLNNLVGSTNAMRNKLASVVSGNRRNLPTFAENIIQATRGTEREATKVVSSDLVEETQREQGAVFSSPTEQRQEAIKSGEATPEGELTQTDRFGEALDVFSEEYQGTTTFTGPDPTEIREGVKESSAPDEFVGLVPSAVNQRTFLQFPTEENFEENVRKQAETDDGVVDPAKEAFVSYVDQSIGLGGGMMGIGGFNVPEDDYEQAQDRHRERSARSRDVDKQKRAPVTTSVEQWMRNPRRFDYPGVDTPTDSPSVQERDKPFVNAENVDKDIDDEDDFGFNIPGL